MSTSKRYIAHGSTYYFTSKDDDLVELAYNWVEIVKSQEYIVLKTYTTQTNIPIWLLALYEGRAISLGDHRLFSEHDLAMVAFISTLEVK
jgi:hypothetical protein